MKGKAYSPAILIILLLDAAVGSSPAPASARQPTDAQAGTAAPSSAEVVERHLQAVGGRAALGKVTALVIRGRLGKGGRNIPLEMDLKAPDKVLWVLTETNGARWRVARAGNQFWTKDAAGRIQSGPVQEEGLCRALGCQLLATAPFGQLRLADLLTNAPCRREQRAGRQCVVVSCPAAALSNVVFEASTGLLAQLGPVAFNDYRQVRGLKLPFQIGVNEGEVKIAVEQIELNPALADALFEVPARERSADLSEQVRRAWTRPPTKDAGPVQWKGNRVVSRVLPYPDFISLFIRLPIAHAAVTGQGVKVAVVQSAGDRTTATLVENIAPGAEVVVVPCGLKEASDAGLGGRLADSGCRVVLVPDLAVLPEAALLDLVRELAARRVLVVVPSDLLEEPPAIERVNKLHALGALSVGRVNRQSLVMADTMSEHDAARPYNRRIRSIQTDVFSTVGLGPALEDCPAATAAGVVALVLEKWPALPPAEVRQKIIAGARAVWQGTSVESGRWDGDLCVDPVTTRYVPKEEKLVFRFRALDAAGALGVDTDTPWFLNMLNCQKAWEITRGAGTVVVVTDQGFHLKHPDLVPHIQTSNYFGPLRFDVPEQNFHGTDMSRILLAVAPAARIVPVLCSGKSHEPGGDLAGNIARSFGYAVQMKADAVSASWAGWFNRDEKLLAAIRDAVDRGVVVSWFHYPQPYPGLVRSSFTYAAGWGAGERLGFADRFLTDPPGFHPVEIEAGLSGTAPQAAGIAALVKSVNPKLAPKEIEALIYEQATPIGGGVLIPDAHKAVLAAKPRNGGKT